MLMTPKILNSAIVASELNLQRFTIGIGHKNKRDELTSTSIQI